MLRRSGAEDEDCDGRRQPSCVRGTVERFEAARYVTAQSEGGKRMAASMGHGAGCRLKEGSMRRSGSSLMPRQ